MTRDSVDYLPGLLRELDQRADEARRAALAQAADSHPRDPRPTLLLAAALVHAGRIGEAEAAYRETLHRAPDWAIARFQLGLLQFTSARVADAQATWAPLDALDETNALRLFKTGLGFLAEDKFDLAREWIERGLQHNHDNPPLNGDMRLVLERMSRMTAGQGAAPPAQAGSESTHFLVSSYRNLG